MKKVEDVLNQPDIIGEFIRCVREVGVKLGTHSYADLPAKIATHPAREKHFYHIAICERPWKLGVPADQLYAVREVGRKNGFENSANDRPFVSADVYKIHGSCIQDFLHRTLKFPEPQRPAHGQEAPTETLRAA